MSQLTTDPTTFDFATQPIRTVIASFPETMPIFAEHGMDMCCGGGNTIREAADAHGMDAEALLAQVHATIAQARETR